MAFRSILCAFRVACCCPISWKRWPRRAQGLAVAQVLSDPPKGITLQEEYGRAFLIAQAQWKAFSATLERQDLDLARTTLRFIQEFLRDCLGYGPLENVGAVDVGDRRYAIDFMAYGRVPVVVAPHPWTWTSPIPALPSWAVAHARKAPSNSLRSFSMPAPSAPGASEQWLAASPAEGCGHPAPAQLSRDRP